MFSRLHSHSHSHMVSMAKKCTLNSIAVHWLDSLGYHNGDTVLRVNVRVSQETVMAAATAILSHLR